MDEDWNDLRFLLAVVRGGSLAKAGAELGVNPSTVFRRVGRLEEQIGARLFERRSRGWEATEAGAELARRAEDIERAMVAARRVVEHHDQAVRGTVRFTTTDTLAQGLLAPHLAEFRATFPEVSVAVEVARRVFALGRGEADVALRPGGRPTEADVIVREAGVAAGAFYASQSYLARRGRPASHQDLASHEILGLDPSFAHTAYGALIERLIPEAAIGFRCSHLTTQVALLRGGAGIAALPCYLVDHLPDVERLFGIESALEVPLWIVFHHDNRSIGRVKAFVDFLGERLEGERDRLAGASAPVA